MAEELHEYGVLCVNRPLECFTCSSKVLVFTSDHGLKNDLEQSTTVMVSIHLYNDESYLQAQLVTAAQ